MSLSLGLLKRSEPHVVTLLNVGTNPRRRWNIDAYPAIKVPGRKKPLLISWKAGEPAPAKNFDAAMAIAKREIARGIKLHTAKQKVKR
jgi:hypothetical protein